jgi:BA14K-like protein
MTSSTPVIEPNPDTSEQRKFRGTSSLSGRQRRSRCASSLYDRSGNFIVPTRVAVRPRWTLHDIEEHHKWAVEWSERIQPAGGSPHAPERGIAGRSANYETARDAAVQHWWQSLSALPELSTAQSSAGNRPLRSDTASGRPWGPRTSLWITAIAAMVLLPAVIDFMMESPFSRFWDRQAGDNTVGLASSSSMPMNSLGRQGNALTPRLVAHESRGVSGEPVRLGLTLAGPAEGGVVLIAGLVPGMSLSSGSPAGADTWRVPATDLANIWIGPPQNFVGVAKLSAELQLPDTTIAHRVSIDVEWITATAAGPDHMPIPSRSAHSEQAPVATGPADPDEPRRTPDATANSDLQQDVQQSSQPTRTRDDQDTARVFIDAQGIRRPIVPRRLSEPAPEARQEDTGVAEVPDAKPAQEASDELSPEHMSQRQCDYRGCASAYRSFRASDCTYQPRRGKRRLCEKGG